MPRSKRNKKRKKVILHQTRKRIDGLVERRSPADEITGYSASQLDGYESLFRLIYQRTGRLPGLDPKDTSLGEVYRQEISHRWGWEELRSHCVANGLRIQTRWVGTTPIGSVPVLRNHHNM